MPIVVIDGGVGSPTVIFNGCGGGMEPMAPILVVDGGVGGLCQQRSSSMEAAVGWIRWWPCRYGACLGESKTCKHDILRVFTMSDF